MKEPKLQPQNLQAERALLGCLILCWRIIDDVRQLVSASDFWSSIHAVIFTVMLRMADAGRVVDELTLSAELEAAGKLEEIGGAAYVIELLEAVPHSDHASHYAFLVAQCAKRRKAIEIGQQLIDRAYDASIEPSELCEAAHDAAMKIAESLNVKNSRPRLLREHVDEIIEQYRQGHSPAVRWGIPAIDDMIGGVMPGEMIVVGARPSMGKSLVALQWVDEASRKGIPGLIISEEMSAASLANRSLSNLTCIPQDEWHKEADRIAFDAREHFQNRAPILIAEKCATAAAAERAIARAVQSHGVRIVAVDYCQLLEGSGDSKEQRVADVSARMKTIAMKFDLVVLLLCQLNRQIEGRPKASPQLSDLRDSGSLEQDADVALFPYWPIKIDEKYKDEFEYRIYCRKNRNRGVGEHVIVMRINPARQRIESVYQHENEFGEVDF